MADEKLSWLFSLEDKMSPVAVNISISLADVRGKLADTSKGMEELASAQEKTAHATEGGRHALFEWVEIAKSAYEVAEKVVEKVVDLGRELLGSAGQAEKMSLRLKLTFGKEKAEELEKYVASIAKFSAFKPSELMGALVELGSKGFKGEGLTRALAAAQDLAAMKGVDLSTASHMLAMVRSMDAMGKGGGGAGRLGRMLPFDPKELEEASRKAGSMTEGIFALLAKRSAEAGLKYGGTVGGAGAEAATGLDGILKRVRGIPERFGESLAGGPALEKLEAFLGRVETLLSPDSPVGKKIQESMSAVFGVITDKLAEITPEQIENFTNRVLSLLDRLTGGSEGLSDGLDGLITTFKALAWVVEFASDFLEGIGWAIGTALAAIYVFAWDVYDFFNRRLYLAIRGAVAGAATWLWDVGASIVHGLVGGIKSAVSAVEDAVSSVGKAVVGKLKDLLGIHSPSAVFAEMGRQSAAGFAVGLTGGAAPELTLRTFGAAGGGGGHRTANVSVNVVVEGGRSPTETADVLRAKLQEMMPSLLQSAFEQMAVEQGAA